ncbi:MAG: DUF2829 domain-containing protein [Clostridia bacterium]|nr:DUF2829 domain-containing protein [Clostridia bacterium]
MNFKQALEAMKKGHKVKLPSWGGYWEYDASIDGIVIHCKEGNILYNCTERLLYTAENIISDEWIIADENNTTILGGEATFNFGEAIKYLKRGFKVARKGWNGKGIYLEMQKPDENSKMTLPYIYIVTNTLVSDNPHAPRGIVPWLASQTDMLCEDWVFVD